MLQAMEDGEHNFASDGEYSIKKKLRTFIVPIHIVISNFNITWFLDVLVREPVDQAAQDLIN